MDRAALELVHKVAGLPTSCEANGGVDFELDNLIFTARAIRRREQRANDNLPPELGRDSLGFWI
jgi:hypothetical protein